MVWWRIRFEGSGEIGSLSSRVDAFGFRLDPLAALSLSNLTRVSTRPLDAVEASTSPSETPIHRSAGDRVMDGNVLPACTAPSPGRRSNEKSARAPMLRLRCCSTADDSPHHPSTHVCCC